MYMKGRNPALVCRTWDFHSSLSKRWDHALKAAIENLLTRKIPCEKNPAPWCIIEIKAKTTNLLNERNSTVLYAIFTIIKDLFLALFDDRLVKGQQHFDALPITSLSLSLSQCLIIITNYSVFRANHIFNVFYPPVKIIQVKVIWQVQNNIFTRIVLSWLDSHGWEVGPIIKKWETLTETFDQGLI